MTELLVAAGDFLGDAKDYAAGSGCYVRNGAVYASLIGRRSIANVGNKRTLSVVSANNDLTITPTVGAVVTCKILRISARHATAAILCVGDKPLKENFAGIIRAQDISMTDLDKVQVYKCFRPGDIVVALVLSLGDRRNFYLSTADNDHGVVYATSQAGGVMVPTSWTTMRCPLTMIDEHRKVARVVAPADNETNDEKMQ